MKQHLNGPVELRDLTDSRSLGDLAVLHRSETTVRVRDIALIADIEEITAVGPDTVIVLSDRAARGGWMLSAALRYAWERRASALIVPEASITETAVQLARRLDVSLLTSRRDPTRLALDVALQIGVARAGSAARIQALADRVARADTLSTVMGMISRELGGRPVRIESSGAITIDVAEQAAETEPPLGETPFVEVAVPIRARPDGPELLTASVREHEGDYAKQLLRAVVPSVRALLGESRLQAIRDSLPPITITALTGSPKAGLIEDPTRGALAAFERWPISGPYVAMCILAADRERIGTAVHQIWQGHFPDVPLARIADGWLTFMPVRDEDAHARLVGKMRARFDSVRGLGLRVGISRRHLRAEQTVDSVREAWLAARLADDGSGAAAGSDDAGADASAAPGETGSSDASGADGSGLLVFGEVPSRLLGRLLPADLAAQLAQVLLPELLADPAADEVIEAVVGYLASRGSVSGAARLLGVHRNTLQTRLRRAEELGVSLSDPEEVLPMHMLLAALAGHPDQPR